MIYGRRRFGAALRPKSSRSPAAEVRESALISRDRLVRFALVKGPDHIRDFLNKFGA